MLATLPEVTNAQHEDDDRVKTKARDLGGCRGRQLACGVMSIRASVVFASSALALLGACDSGAGRIDTACQSNADCGADELCGTGLCEGGIGVCIPRPTMCSDTDEPVCGCDGLTYQNVCFAELAGVRISTAQPCVCESNGDCRGEQYCALENSCFNPGLCLPRPQMCDPADTQTVCGCLGNTHPNACESFRAAERVSALGGCDCTDDQSCAAGQYCDANTCDGPGGCVEQPTACPPDGPSVTGCDGVVYENACEAARLGVRVRPEG